MLCSIYCFTIGYIQISHTHIYKHKKVPYTCYLYRNASKSKYVLPNVQIVCALYNVCLWDDMSANTDV